MFIHVFELSHCYLLKLCISLFLLCASCKLLHCYLLVHSLVDIFSSLNRDEFLKKNSDAAGANGVMNEEIVKDLEDFGNKSRKSVTGPRIVCDSPCCYDNYSSSRNFHLNF